MNPAEQNIAPAARMYECRTAARQILGEKYPDKMRELAEVVRAVAARDKCSDIVAGATVIKSAGLEGMQSLLQRCAGRGLGDGGAGEMTNYRVEGT